MSLFRAANSAGCSASICAYVHPSNAPAWISSKTFHRSFGKGSSSAVWMVRTSVDVQTDTGMVPPSLVSGTRSTMTSGSSLAYASPRHESGESPPSFSPRLYSDSPGRVSQILRTRATPALQTCMRKKTILPGM